MLPPPTRWALRSWRPAVVCGLPQAPGGIWRLGEEVCTQEAASRSQGLLFPSPSSLPCPFQTAPQAGPPSLPCLRVVGAAVMWQEGHQARPDEHGAAPERRPRDGRKVPLWLSSLDALLGVWRSFRTGLCVRPLAAIFVRWYSGGAHPLLGPGVRGDRAESRLGGGPRRQKADAPPPRLRGGSGSVLILEAGQGVPEKSVLWPTGRRRQGMSQGEWAADLGVVWKGDEWQEAEWSKVKGLVCQARESGLGSDGSLESRRGGLEGAEAVALKAV